MAHKVGDARVMWEKRSSLRLDDRKDSSSLSRTTNFVRTNLLVPKYRFCNVWLLQIFRFFVAELEADGFDSLVHMLDGVQLKNGVCSVPQNPSTGHGRHANHVLLCNLFNPIDDGVVSLVLTTAKMALDIVDLFAGGFFCFEWTAENTSSKRGLGCGQHVQ